MIRAIKELFRPALKCERLGHSLVERTHKIRRKSSYMRFVVEDFKAKRMECRRCHHKEDWHAEEWADGFTGCSMPSHLWDEIREKGYLIISSH